MEIKKTHIIIIGLIILIITLSTLIFLTINTNNITYEKIELNPNGTNLEVPSEKLKYDSVVETGAKIWSFKQGSVMTFNSEETKNINEWYSLGGEIGISSIKETIVNNCRNKENINGFTVYTVNGEDVNINRDVLYCIILENTTTHETIIITTGDKEVTLHIAESVQFKSSNNTSNNNTDNVTVSNTAPSSSSNNNVKNTNNQQQDSSDNSYIDYDEELDVAYDTRDDRIISSGSSNYDDSFETSVSGSSEDSGPSGSGVETTID